MIAFINGILVFKEPSEVIIDCNGVGYHLFITLNTFQKLPELNNECKLHTYLSIREDAHVLFGFKEFSEKKFFQSLISISGIGPATAINILSAVNPSDLQRWIVSGDVKTIKSIKGIGPKTAERLVLELKDKLGKETISSETGVKSFTDPRRIQAIQALTNLGLPRINAEKSVDLVLNNEKDISIEELIKKALKS